MLQWQLQQQPHTCLLLLALCARHGAHIKWVAVAVLVEPPVLLLSMGDPNVHGFGNVCNGLWVSFKFCYSYLLPTILFAVLWVTRMCTALENVCIGLWVSFNSCYSYLLPPILFAMLWVTRICTDLETFALGCATSSSNSELSWVLGFHPNRLAALICVIGAHFLISNLSSRSF